MFDVESKTAFPAEHLTMVFLEPLGSFLSFGCDVDDRFSQKTLQSVVNGLYAGVSTTDRNEATDYVLDVVGTRLEEISCEGLLAPVAPST